jgi:hypothetical protein
MRSLLRTFEQSFQELGFSAREARIRGYIAYAIMMGDSILKETLREGTATEKFVELAVRLLAPLAIVSADRGFGNSRAWFV